MGKQDRGGSKQWMTAVVGPSTNRELCGSSGTSRFVSFGLGEADSEANTLNASQVATIIRSTGWRL